MKPEELEDKIAAKRTLYKFSAVWCGPCKSLDKTLKGLLLDFPNINVIDVDVDAEAEFANQMGVKSVPTLVMDGRVLKGNVPHSQLKAFLEGKAHG